MKKYATTIFARDPKTKEMKNWVGPNVPGISFQDAQKYCNQNGLGYCHVDGELIAEIPTKNDGITPDWNGMIDYEQQSLN